MQIKYFKNYVISSEYLKDEIKAMDIFSNWYCFNFFKKRNQEKVWIYLRC